MRNDLIALFDFEDAGEGLALNSEKHYRLVAPGDVTPEDLAAYSTRPF